MRFTLAFLLLATLAQAHTFTREIRLHTADNHMIYARITCKKGPDGKPGQDNKIHLTITNAFGSVIDTSTFTANYCATPADVASLADDVFEAFDSSFRAARQALLQTIANPARGRLYIANDTGGNGRREIFSLNAATGQGGPVLDTNDRIFGGLALAVDGKRLYAVVGPSTFPENAGPAYVAYIDVATNTITDRVMLPTLNTVKKPALSPDGRTLYFVASDNGGPLRIQVLDVATKTMGAAFPAPPSPVDAQLRAAAVSPDGAMVCVSETTGIHCYDTRSRTYVGRATMSIPTPNLRPLFHPNGGRLYMLIFGSSADGSPYTVAVADTTTLSIVARIPLTQPVSNQFPQLSITPDGLRLFIDDPTEGVLRVVDTRTNRVVQTTPGLTTGGLGGAIVKP